MQGIENKKFQKKQFLEFSRKNNYETTITKSDSALTLIDSPIIGEINTLKYSIVIYDRLRTKRSEAYYVYTVIDKKTNYIIIIQSYDTLEDLLSDVKLFLNTKT